MSFERQRRVASLWNWLPAFRAAAEFESIQRAGLALHLSPSAISRTIKQLEEAVGYAVFERHATGVRLTERGERLLVSTRAGMRLIDDALEPLGSGALRFAATPPFLPSLLVQSMPAEQGLVALTILRAALATMLLRGEVDLVLSDEPDESPGLTCREVARLPMVLSRRATVAADAPLVSTQLGERQVADLHALMMLSNRLEVRIKVPRALAPADHVFELCAHEVLTVYVITRDAALGGSVATDAMVTRFTEALAPG